VKTQFLEKHYYEYQYGFREKQSVVHTLLDVTSLSFDAIQNKQHTIKSTIFGPPQSI